MQEFFLTVQRQINGKRFSNFVNDPNREYWALKTIASTSALEEIMAMQRRMMVGAMRDPTAMVFTIVVAGFEEAVTRCTMVYRDQLWDWVIGSSAEETESDLKCKRLVQAASAASGMRVEITCIIMSR